MEIKRYYKIVFENEEEKIKFETEALNGNFFQFIEGSSGELIIKTCKQPIVSNSAFLKLPGIAAREYAEVLSVYTDNDGNQAVIPCGWTVSKVNKENTIFGVNCSLVIYRIPKEKVCYIDWTNSHEVETLQRTYDQFVWTPVNLLKPNGTLDGDSFTEKFGRRNYRNVEFSESEYNEVLTDELVLQKESVDKYGGFFSSRYDISEDSKDKGRPRSIKGAYPWINEDRIMDYPSIANSMFKGEITSHLMYGAEYDTREEWVIETKTKTFNDIAKDSSKWGNHWDTEGFSNEMLKTGACEEWCVNNIYDFTGNVTERTQEKHGSSSHVIRGCHYYEYGYHCPADYRNYDVPFYKYNYPGFRVTICIR